MVEQYNGKSVVFYVTTKDNEPVIYVDTGLQKSVLVYEDVFSKNKNDMRRVARQIRNGQIKDLSTLFEKCKGVIVLRGAREWIL